MNDRRPIDGPRLGRLLWLAAVVVACLACLASAPSARAAVPFNGGPDVYPLYVPNDHTPVAIHFTATGLPDTTKYYLKVRFNTSQTPSPTGNRGWIWNAVSGQWVQERDDWTKFPTVTTDGSGNVSGWLYAKFGDETLSGAYYIIISLTPFPYGNGQVLNSNTSPKVTVLDMGATTGPLAGAWVHDAPSARPTAGALVAAVASPAPSPSSDLACAPTAADAVDGNADGKIGAEDYGYGPTTSGDFRLAVPLDQPFGVLLDGVPWSASAGLGALVTEPDFFVTLPYADADADIAHGSDQMAPSAPTGLSATAGHDEVDLSWAAATYPDPNYTAAALAYDVYRWSDPTPIGGATSYSSPRLLVGRTPQGATSYADTTAQDGAAYHYLVRAVDPATNVGPRSLTVNAAPAPTTATLTTATPVVAYGKSATLRGALSVGPGALLGEPVALQWSATGGDPWQTLAIPNRSTTGAYTYVVTPQDAVKTWYRVSFAGAAPYGAATSAAVAVTPQTLLAAPSVPRSLKAGRSFAATGVLRPAKAARARVVRIRCYRLVKKAWVLKGTAWASGADRLGFTRYRATLRLPAAGKWRLQASFAGDRWNAAGSSPFRNVTVR